MHPGALDGNRIAPSAAAVSAIAALFVDEIERDMPRVAMPRPETHLVVRFGPSARGGLDVYAFGAQERARRKLIRGGQRVVIARLRLDAQEAVLGVPAAVLAGRIVAVEELWGDAATRRLVDRLGSARSTLDAAAVLDGAIAERLARAKGSQARAVLALAAAARLENANVNAVADELGVSERHLRRVFREKVGMSPKAFAKLTRFHRALGAAYEEARASWADIATASGYYDQAHLIAEFRSITGVTPQALLGELRAAPNTHRSRRT